MYTVFTDETINTRKLPTQSSLIKFSLYKELYCPLPFRSFSIKYVGKGCEKYTVNGNKFHVNAGQYLVANHFSTGSIEIESKETVKGICIDVAPDLLASVVATFQQPNNPFADLTLDKFFNTSEFYENKYQAATTTVGAFLMNLDAELSKNPHEEYQFTNEFYFNLAEKIVNDHVLVFKQLQSIPSLKNSTKKDLYRKVMLGKQFIETHFKSNMDVKQIAAESFLSEYHFYRLFKTAFGKSPYQYLTEKRLCSAAQLIQKSHATVTEAALLSGFTDVYSFSKSFKKYFGFPPSFLNNEE